MTRELIGWEPPEVTSELAALIARVQSAEQSVQDALQSTDVVQRNALLRTLVIGDAADVCEPPVARIQDIEELCEACLQARGPLDGAAQRCMLRERARIHAHLAKETPAIRQPEDLLALWNEATRGEPKIRLFVDEARWRTDADGLPFTGARMALLFDPLPLTPGLETADPADIPQLAKVVTDFAGRRDLPVEVVALGMFYLIFRIHPFVDGNGHTIRMLVCDILHRGGYSEPTLLAFVDALRMRHKELCHLSIEVSLGKANTQDHIAFLLDVMLQAQSRVTR